MQHRDECYQNMEMSLYDRDADISKAFMTIVDSSNVQRELPDAAVHGLELEFEVDLAAEPGSRTVTAKEVKASTGKTAEGWTRAIEEEFMKDFAGRNVFTVSTDAEKRAYGMPLPMKLVYVHKSNG